MKHLYILNSLQTMTSIQLGRVFIHKVTEIILTSYWEELTIKRQIVKIKNLIRRSVSERDLII